MPRVTAVIVALCIIAIATAYDQRKELKVNEINHEIDGAKQQGIFTIH